MTTPVRHTPASHAAINVDEVGIRYAVIGEVRLRTICQPIFALHAGAIVPVAVQAMDAGYRAGTVLKAHEIMACLSRGERAGQGAIFRRLHLHNLANISEAPLDLHIAPDAAETDVGAVTLDMARLVDEAASIGIDAQRLVFDLTGMALSDPAAAVESSTVLRRTGARIALDTVAMGGIGTGASSQPDIVRLPAHWLHVLARDPASGRLLSTMVATLRRRAIMVQAEGIESASHLRMAMEADVDTFQGSLLGEPALAGAAFDEEPRPVASLLVGFSNIVTLLAR